MKSRGIFRFPGLAAGLSVLAVVLLAPASWAFDVFMKIEGIPGEATVAKYKDWIEVQGFSLEASTPFNPRTGDPTGSPKAEPLMILKRFDKATPLLFKALVQGRHFRSVMIEFVLQAGEQTIVFFTIELKNAVVVSMKASGNAGPGSLQTDAQINPNLQPMEQVGFTFHRIRLTDIPLGPDGKPGTPVVVECDFARDICQ